MANATIVQEGAFTSDIRNALNSNFTNLATGGTSTAATYTQTLLSGSSDAVPVTAPGFYVVTTAGVDAMTLAAPATAQNGIELFVCSNTAQAHTITATGLFMNGGAASPYTTATFAAKVGAGVNLVAYGGKWIVIGSQGITFT